MKPSVYIESSIVSYLASRPSRDVIVAARQAITHDWWSNHKHRFDLRISAQLNWLVSCYPVEPFQSGTRKMRCTSRSPQRKELIIS